MSVNTGTTYGRVDVVGLRQTPGDHSVDTELICIEVKRGKDPVLKAMGQAYGYSVATAILAVLLLEVFPVMDWTAPMAITPSE